MSKLIVSATIAGVVLWGPVCSAQLVCGTLPDLAEGAPVTVSSAVDSPTGKYGALRITDGNPDSWWAASNARLPQWLEIRFATPQQVDTVVLIGAANPALYANLKHIRCSFSEGRAIEQDLPDHPGPFVIRCEPHVLTWLKLEITQTHDPAKTYVGAAQVSTYYDPQKRVKVKVSPRQSWQAIDLTERPRSEHPCVYVTPADVAAARERIKAEPWAREYAASVLAAADAALQRPEEWYRKLVPAHGACFAYGFTGCPICRASWGTWGGARCTWDHPGHVTCGNGHVLPDAQHPDPGTGYRGPDGRIHYFVGSWNAWVTEKLIHEFAGNLAVAYSLTGEEKYAARAALVLDLIADLYPSCDKGSWDYPSNPPSGRLARPWYQVARVLVRLVDFYDQIYACPALDQPSLTPGLTRRQNIERNMIENGARYCYEQSLAGGLNNGEADYIRGALAAGCLLGIESYVRWAYDGPYGIQALVRNNVCRDGRYFETSVMYADHSRELYLTFADPLWNWRSPRFPHGINVYEDPVFRSFYLLPALAIECAGHSPRFGDSGPDTSRLFPSAVLASPTDQRFAEVLYARAAGAAREEFGALLSVLSGGHVVRARAAGANKEWLVFHAAPPPSAEARLPQALARRVHETNFFGQKGVAILRAGRGAQAQAALVRFGPSLNHGHRDDLNLNYYAAGYELTYDLGYSLGSTHTQVGWARQTAAHNLVLVDEKPQGPDSERDGSGGSLHLVAGLPGLQLADCSAEPTYQSLGVSEYRRCTALVGEGEDSYLLDIFRVKGGHQHDYVFHALSDKVDFEGVTPGPAAAGSLAGPDVRWGELQGNDGDMMGFPNRPYWCPPPENGFGFLMAPQRAPAGDGFRATWREIGGQDCHLRLSMLPEPDTELVTCWAPGIYPQRQGAYGSPGGFPRTRSILARRRGTAPLASTYVALLEPYGARAPRGAYDAATLAQIATATAGEVKPVPTVGVVLFKATGPNDEMRMPLTVPRAGRYTITAGVYGSPAYGVAQLSIDGKPRLPLLNEPGTVREGTGATVRLGDADLTAGEHTFAVRVVTPTAGNHWIGLQFIGVGEVGEGDEDGRARPFLTTVQRVPCGGGTVAVRVDHTSGRSDCLIYRPEPGESVTCGEGAAAVETDGLFARVSSGAGRVSALAVVGGTRVAAPGLALSMPHAGFTGTVDRIDYPRSRLHTPAQLPADGRLVGEPLYLTNPAYSRNTVYRITGITAEADGSTIDLGPASLITGFADLDDDPADAHTLTTLNPHEYSRALGRPDSGFFHGKLLADAELKQQTTIRATRHGQPFRITVDSAEGFAAGQRVYYHDVRAGDSFRISATATLTTRPDGTLSVQSTDDLTVTCPGELQVSEGDTWKPVAGRRLPWRVGGWIVRLVRKAGTES